MDLELGQFYGAAADGERLRRQREQALRQRDPQSWFLSSLLPAAIATGYQYAFGGTKGRVPKAVYNGTTTGAKVPGISSKPMSGYLPRGGAGGPSRSPYGYTRGGRYGGRYKKRSKRTRGSRFARYTVRKPTGGGKITAATRSVVVRRTSRAPKKVSFAQRVRKIIHNESEAPAIMWQVLGEQPDGGASGTKNIQAADPTVVRAVDLFRARSADDFCAPAGLNIFTSRPTTAIKDEADPSTLVQTHMWNYGETWFPFNCTKRETGYQDGVYPIGDGSATDHWLLRYRGKEFFPKYCVVDYGWLPGSSCFDESPYHATEIAFGIVKNHKVVKALMTELSLTWDQVMNLVLGPSAGMDLSLATTSLPRRPTSYDANSGLFTQEHTGLHKRLAPHIKILKRDIKIHRPLVQADADGGDGVSFVSAESRRRMSGQGTFTFPASELKTLELRQEPNTVDPITTLDPTCREPDHQAHIPFIHARGSMVVLSGGTNSQYDTVYDKSPHLFLRWKIKIADNAA